MRVVAALVLAPLAIAIAYAGGWLWACLVTLASIGLYRRMADGRRRGAARCASRPQALSRSRSQGCASPPGASMPRLSCWRIGFVAVVLISPERRGWTAAGFFYAAAAEIASVLVRLDPAKGFVALMLVLLVVWVTDIGGYFAGRGIGGPKLWPRVSPKKTWAGAIGGFVASLVVAGGFAAFGSRQNRAAFAAGRNALGGLAARRSLRVRGEAAVWRQGFQPHHSRPWRAAGSPGRICRSRRHGGDFRVSAGRRRWRRPRSYGLVKQ